MQLHQVAKFLGLTTHATKRVLDLPASTRANDNLDAETVAYVINANYHTQGVHNVHATR